MHTLHVLMVASALTMLSAPVLAAPIAQTCGTAGCVTRPIQLAKDCSKLKAQKDACQRHCNKRDNACIGRCMEDWENCMNGH